MRTRVVGVLLVLSGCGPQTVTPDAGPAVCQTLTKSPPNLARNAEFECGDPTLEFQGVGTAATVVATTGRSGKGLKLTTAPGLYNDRFSSMWKVIAPAAGKYCLKAWVKGTAPTISARLSAAGNGFVGGNDFNLPGPVAAWTKLPPNVKLDADAKAGDEVTVVFFDKTATAGSVIEIDDLDLWVTTEGQCNDAR